MAEANGAPATRATEPAPTLRDELERGLRFSHIMMQTGQDRENQALADVLALINLLVEKGVLGADEVEAERDRAREQVEQIPQPRIRLGDFGDKYADESAVEIDCASRIHLCQARCCTFNFYLSAQDLDEGVARWDYGNPYWIKRGADGYCVHCDPTTRACGIHDKRPHVCRRYDCRDDKRIWIDFEQRIPAPLDDVEPPLRVAMAKPHLDNPYPVPQGGTPAPAAQSTTDAS